MAPAGSGPLRSAVVGVALAATVVAVDARASGFEYLYIEPNSGSSSGGHVAVALDRDVYHFQHHPDGTLRLHRDAAQAFDWAYRSLENRGIHVLRIETDGGSAEELSARFQRRALEERRAFDRLDSLDADLAWLAGDGPAPGGVPGAAAFDWSGSPGPPVLLERVELEHGAGFVAARRRELAAAIRALDPDPEAFEAPCAVPEGGCPRVAGLLDRLRDLSAAWLAMDWLERPRPLDPQRLTAPASLRASLSAAERARLEGWKRELEAAVSRLAVSKRPDAGVAMLVAMARHGAVERSLAEGRLWLLDPFESDEPLIAPRDDAGRRAVLEAVLAEREADADAARERFATVDVLRESDLSRLELAAAFAAEVRRALESGAAIRRPPRQALPLRAAWPPDSVGLPRPELDRRRSALAARRLEAARERHVALLERELGYDLIERNCATELLEMLDVERSAGDFMPSLSADAVAGARSVVAEELRPSYRDYHLARLAERDGELRTALAESNVLSARLYRHGNDDSPFLFFTTDLTPARPVLGAANLVVGATASGVGLLAAPFDGGALLGGGLDGMLFSFPELVFVNIRKGSYALLPRDWEGWEG